MTNSSAGLIQRSEVPPVRRDLFPDRLRYGVSEQDLIEKRLTPAFVGLMRFEVGRTRSRLMRGYPLAELVPPEVRPDIELFIEGGLAILDAIEAANFDTLTQRPALSRWAKGRLVLSALWRKLLRFTPLGARWA